MKRIIFLLLGLLFIGYVKPQSNPNQGVPWGEIYFQDAPLKKGFRYSTDLKIHYVQGDIPDFVYSNIKIYFEIEEPLSITLSTLNSKGLYGCPITEFIQIEREPVLTKTPIEYRLFKEHNNLMSINTSLSPGKYLISLNAVTRKKLQDPFGYYATCRIEMALDDKPVDFPVNPVPDIDPVPTPTPIPPLPPITDLPPSAHANYILSRTMQNDAATVYLDKIDYFDGLGRPVQSILKAASPLKKDIVTLQEYDGVGRESNTWLPTPIGGTGAYADAASLKSAANSFYADGSPYSNPVYEVSPLNRVLEQYGPGAAWRTAARPVKTGYHTNTANGTLSCGLYTVPTAASLQRNGFYAANELFVTQTTDEDGNLSYTFTDKLGQMLLQRLLKGEQTEDTYYVYDDFGNLRYVLPAAASQALSGVTSWSDTHPVLQDYAYIYKYDGRNRCMEKKLPGQVSVEMKYDNSDRLIFSRDGVQKTKGEWTFHFYDVFGRETVTGSWKSATVPATESIVVKTDYTGTGLLAGYAVNVPLSPADLMHVNYYDNYNFVDILPTAEKAKMPYTTVAGYDDRYTGGYQGFLTGFRTYQLNDASKYIVSARYYDHRSRVVQTHTSNHLGGFEDEYFAYTFTGKIKQRSHVHSATGKAVQTEVYTYTYDHGERLISLTHKLNSSPAVTLAEYTYDEAGRLKGRKLHGSAEALAYHYNLRGWLTGISGSKFSQTLAYNTSVNGLTPAKDLYNGNIAAMKWKSGNETTERGYRFTYDGVNRMTQALYGEGVQIESNTHRFNESLTYDNAGNIQTLERHGKIDQGYGLTDRLAYVYSGNKLTKVSDAATAPITYPGAFHFIDRANSDTEYAYDANGNLTQDLNKNITGITYNSLNLPQAITFSSGNTVNYRYDAGGEKLSVAYTSAGNTVRTDYVANKVYRNGTLSMILTQGGYITLSGVTPTYHYYLEDHQGNNRVVIDQSGAIEQVNHYYPFGGLFGEGLQASNQPYRYNGKEFDRFQNLDMYDYGARHYDAAVGRWWTVDPLAEKYYNISPYAYVANNPVNLIDPNGMWSDWFQSESGAVLWRDSQAKQLSVGGETFNNIGKSYSLAINDGSYLNYFDNVPLSVSNAPVNTWGKVLNNNGLRTQLLSMSSPLSESSKVSLFQASINKGRQDFIDHPLTKMTINALLFIVTGGLDIAPVAGSRIAGQAAKTSTQFTKSSLPLGREMHKGYKLAEHAPELGRFKEFTGIKGIRPDFVDFGTKTIYELKPFNPRGIQLGTKQLNNYKSIFEQNYGGTWKTVLDHY